MQICEFNSHGHDCFISVFDDGEVIMGINGGGEYLVDETKEVRAAIARRLVKEWRSYIRKNNPKGLYCEPFWGDAHLDARVQAFARLGFVMADDGRMYLS